MMIIKCIILILCLCVVSYAENNESCFQVEEYVSFNDSNSRLSINGKGDMCNCKTNNLKEYRQITKTISFTGSVTSIGSECFKNFENFDFNKFWEF